MGESRDAGPIDTALMEILACPKCRGGLEQQGEQIICTACALAFPIRAGIPVLLIDHAQPAAF